MMAKRPWHYDAVDVLRHPLWVTAADRTGRVVWYEAVDPVIEPRRALANQLSRWANEGWHLETFNSKDTHFYCFKETERRYVGLTTTDPSKHRQITKQL